MFLDKENPIFKLAYEGNLSEVRKVIDNDPSLISIKTQENGKTLVMIAARQGHLEIIIIVDGGKGQVEVARRVLITLEIEGVNLIGIAKGPGRKAGLERIILSDENAEITLSEDSQALHLLQQIRDEAHRFAITTHRKKKGEKKS